MVDLQELENRAHDGTGATPAETLDLVLRTRVAEAALRSLARSTLAAVESAGYETNIVRVGLPGGGTGPIVSFARIGGQA